MAKAENAGVWGRETARKRYADGGGVEVSADEQVVDSPLREEPADRSAEVDEFISRVMRDQIRKMEND